MEVKLTITMDDVRRMAYRLLRDKHCIEVNPEHIEVLVRSKQNYREDKWEIGEIKIEHTLTVMTDIE